MLIWPTDARPPYDPNWTRSLVPLGKAAQQLRISWRQVLSLCVTQHALTYFEYKGATADLNWTDWEGARLPIDEEPRHSWLCIPQGELHRFMAVEGPKHPVLIGNVEQARWPDPPGRWRPLEWGHAELAERVSVCREDLYLHVSGIETLKCVGAGTLRQTEGSGRQGTKATTTARIDERENLIAFLAWLVAREVHKPGSGGPLGKLFKNGRPVAANLVEHVLGEADAAGVRTHLLGERTVRQLVMDGLSRINGDLPDVPSAPAATKKLPLNETE